MCALNMITKTRASPPQHACRGKHHLLLTLRTHEPNTNSGTSHQIQDQPSTQGSDQATEKAKTWQGLKTPEGDPSEDSAGPRAGPRIKDDIHGKIEET